MLYHIPTEHLIIQTFNIHSTELQAVKQASGNKGQ